MLHTVTQTNQMFHQPHSTFHYEQYKQVIIRYVAAKMNYLQVRRDGRGCGHTCKATDTDSDQTNLTTTTTTNTKADKPCVYTMRLTLTLIPSPQTAFAQGE